MALVARWTLQDNAASTTVVATVGSNGTLTGAGNTSASTATSNGSLLTSCLNFDGSNDYVNVGAVTGSPVGSAARTICFWMNADTFDTANTKGVIQYNGSGSTGQAFQFYAEDNAVSVGFNGHRVISPKSALSTGAWYHVAVVVPSGVTTTGQVKVYIDGVNQTLSSESGSSQTLNTGTVDFRIANVGVGYFDGKVFDVRIYDSDESANLATIIAEKDTPGGGAAKPWYYHHQQRVVS